MAMFDENFSFLSSASNTYTSHPDDCSSANISPYGSRSSSPGPHQRSQPGSASQAASRRNSRYDSYRPRHPSITLLTARLESHSLTSPLEFTASPVMTTTPSDTSLETDEGFFDGPDTPASSATDYSIDFDPSLWDLNMTDLNATSSPRPSLSLEAQALNSYTARRRQRQALVRLQCLVKRTPDLAMLLEERHPSSMPLTQDSLCAFASRSNSSTSLSGNSNGRVEKSRSNSSLVRRDVRVRRRPTRTIS